MREKNHVKRTINNKIRKAQRMEEKTTYYIKQLFPESLVLYPKKPIMVFDPLRV